MENELKTGAESNEKALATLQRSVDKLADPSDSVLIGTLVSKIDAIEKQIISRMDEAQSGINELRDADSLICIQRISYDRRDPLTTRMIG